MDTLRARITDERGGALRMITSPQQWALNTLRWRITLVAKALVEGKLTGLMEWKSYGKSARNRDTIEREARHDRQHYMYKCRSMRSGQCQAMRQLHVFRFAELRRAAIHELTFNSRALHGD